MTILGKTIRQGFQKGVLLLLTATPLAHAQAQDPPAAPLPAAVTTAHKLFLGNAGDQENADCLRAYNNFYAGLQKLSRFELVSDANQGDLVLELHYEIDLGQAIASNDSHHTVRQFRVVLLDPHAHVTLWSLTERTNYAVLQKNRNSNLDETVAKLTSDFDALTSAQPPNNNSRVPHGFPIH